eukprot:scaffold249428_cov19-Prasinocladus_malaysianus.AAC.1
MGHNFDSVQQSMRFTMKKYDFVQHRGLAASVNPITIHCNLTCKCRKKLGKGRIQTSIQTISFRYNARSNYGYLL